MEDNFRKPLYKDYKKQRTHVYFWRDPVFSLERSYKLADKPLVVTGGMLIVLAAYIIYSYIPWLDESVFRGTSPFIMLCALLLGERFIHVSFYTVSADFM